jgi:hypothetical protein
MTFLDSSTIRPLYDVHDGGAPRGFQCQLRASETENLVCTKITRTYRGMKMHQRIVHQFKPQGVLSFGRIEPTK